MKKLVITTASVLLIAAGGIGYTAYASSSDKNPSLEMDTTTYQQESETQEQAEEVSSDFKELEVIDGMVDVDDYHAEVVKDNDHKRIILLENDDQKPEYKSIYLKDKNRLKVIDFSDGVIFNDKIDDEGKEVKSKASEDQTKEHKEEVAKEKTEPKESKEGKSLTELDEYSTIKSHADVEDYDAKVVEDNSNKRVIVFKDDNHKPQYKSIYVKHKGFVKIIDLHGGLVYKGSIQ